MGKKDAKTYLNSCKAEIICDYDIFQIYKTEDGTLIARNIDESGDEYYYVKEVCMLEEDVFMPMDDDKLHTIATLLDAAFDGELDSGKGFCYWRIV